MAVTIEWIHKNNVAKIGILRVGKEHSKYGDSYEFSCAVKVSKNTAYFYGGVSGKNNLTNFFKYRNEIKKLFIKEGITQVIWERIKDNKKKIYKVKLPEIKISTEVMEVS